MAARILLPFKKIQIPYANKFRDIWEYKNAYLAGEIDFSSGLDSACPICGREGCYRERKPYWRNAIEIDPYRKEKVPVQRFECRATGRTFSLLPIQLIPYYQYTVAAVVSMIVLAAGLQRQGKSGFEAAAAEADPESGVTAFLVWCWLRDLVFGLRRAHAFLTAHYDLSSVRSGSGRTAAAEEVAVYQRAIAAVQRPAWPDSLRGLFVVYSSQTGLFLMGSPFQYRKIKTA